MLFRCSAVAMSSCWGRSGVCWCHSILATLAYDLVLVSHDLLISGVYWPGCLCLEPVSCAPGLQQISYEICGPGCRRSPGKPTDCGVLRGADTIMCHSGGVDWKGIDSILHLVLISVSKHFTENFHILMHR